MAAFALLAAVLSGIAADAVCTGDCNGDSRVSIDETALGVSIALGYAPLTRCLAFDANGDIKVRVDELITAVANALEGCPQQPTPTATSTTSPTPTATINHPPAFPPASIYRTYPGFDIRLPIGANDPDGNAVQCTVADLPAGASFDEPSGVLRWTPANNQLGPFYVPVSCRDGGTPPAAVAGELTFKVTPLDACTTPSCKPATGCAAELPPVSQPCCAAGPAERVAEPTAGCPAARVLFAGQNVSPDSFGRLQNCDTIRVRNLQQSGAEVQLHIEARCVNTNNRVRLRARLESDARFHPLLFDVETRGFFLVQDADGFARQRGLRFAVDGGGPYFDLEGAEADLSLTLTDSDGVTVTEQVRLRLSFTPQPDRPDVDPTPAAH